MTFTVRAVSFLRELGFPTTAEYLNVLSDEGALSNNGREYKYGNPTRGLYHSICYPVTRRYVQRTVGNNLIYRSTNSEHPFDDTRHAKYVRRLVSRSPLNGRDIKLFDGACNHGYLASNLKQKVRRYVGMDLIEDVIATAKAEANEKFSEIGCSDFKFVQGNLLIKSSYKGIPSDNNLVVCTGTFGHFRPIQILHVLDNLESILSVESDARIVIGVPIIPPDFDRSTFVVNWDADGNVIPHPRQIEKGVRFVIVRWDDGYKYGRYEGDDIIRLLKSHKRLEIDDVIKNGRGIYLSLKRRI